MAPFDLIDNARAVLTIRGTAGWEATIRGKPVLVTGSPLYRHCEGVYVISTVEDCRLALEQIARGVTGSSSLKARLPWRSRSFS